MTIRCPAPLRPGDRIGVTSPSTGVPAEMRPRLDHAVGVLRAEGYDVVVGACMAGDGVVSAPARDRARELTAMLVDPTIRAVVPPWGGELAVDVLEHLDWDAIGRAEPTWLVGFSDIDTLLVPLTLLTGAATLHGQNLMDTPCEAPEPLWSWRRVAAAGPGATVTQGAARRVRSTGFDDYAHETLVYLEAAEAGAFEVARRLHGMRLAGWFEHANGVLIGRTQAPDAAGYTQADAVRDALGPLDVPVVLDVDCGHVPPHLALVNGDRATVARTDGEWTIRQTLD